MRICFVRVITKFSFSQCHSVYSTVIALVDIQELAYQEEKDRCQRDALRFSLAALRFAAGYTGLFENIDKKKRRRVFNAPYHAVVSHMPVMYRVISLVSVAAEAEERMFTDIR